MPKRGHRPRNPTRREQDARILYAANLIAADELTDGEIIGQVVRWTKAEQGDEIERSTARRYLSRARARLREVLELRGVVLKSEAIAEYRQLARMKAATIRDRIRCRERIDAILGLDAPYRHAHEGKVGVTLLDALSDPTFLATVEPTTDASPSTPPPPEAPPGPDGRPPPAA